MPLTSLPPQPVAPSEVILESRAALRRRIVRHSARPMLVMAGVWFLLVLGYAHSAAPAFLVMSPLVMLGGQLSFTQVLLNAGLGPWSLVFALVLVPILGAGLGLVGALAVSGWVARLRPREFRLAVEVPRAAAERLALGYAAPALLAVLAAAVLAVAGVELPWKELTWGPIAGIGGAVAILAGVIAGVLPRSIRILDILRPDAGTAAGRTGAGSPSDEGTAASAAPALTAGDQEIVDIRMSPRTRVAPFPGPELRTLGALARRSVSLVAIPTGIVLWVTGGIGDLVVVIDRVSEDGAGGGTGRGLTLLAVGVGVVLAGLVAAACAAAPRLAVRLRRSSVSSTAAWDPRSDAAREAARPWQAKVTGSIMRLMAGAVLLGSVLWWPLGALAAPGSGIVPTTAIIGILVVSPLMLAVGRWVGDTDLWDVLDGRLGQYSLRRSPWALVAPEMGTRTQMADDPRNAPIAPPSAAFPRPGAALPSAIPPAGVAAHASGSVIPSSGTAHAGAITASSAGAAPVGATTGPPTGTAHPGRAVPSAAPGVFRRRRTVDLPDFEDRAARRRDPRHRTAVEHVIPDDISDLTRS